MMPYRGSIDAVLERCDELREQLQTLAGVRVEAPSCSTLEDALMWESHLRAELQSFGGVVLPARHPRVVINWIPLVMVASLVVAVGAFMLASTPHRAAESRMLLAGNIVRSPPPPARAGDRCEIEVHRNPGTCTIDVDCICPTIERRGSAHRCIEPGLAISARTSEFDLDGERGRLDLMTPDGIIEIQLDTWR